MQFLHNKAPKLRITIVMQFIEAERQDSIK